MMCLVESGIYIYMLFLKHVVIRGGEEINMGIGRLTILLEYPLMRGMG